MDSKHIRSLKKIMDMVVGMTESAFGGGPNQTRGGRRHLLKRPLVCGDPLNLGHRPASRHAIKSGHRIGEQEAVPLAALLKFLGGRPVAGPWCFEPVSLSRFSIGTNPQRTLVERELTF